MVEMELIYVLERHVLEFRHIRVRDMDVVDRKCRLSRCRSVFVQHFPFGSSISVSLPGNRAEIDPENIGMPIAAFIRMSITGVDYSHIIEVAEESREILECHRGTGGDSFIMRVVVESVEHLQEVIDRLTPYGITTTTIVLSSSVKDRPIAIYAIRLFC